MTIHRQAGKVQTNGTNGDKQEHEETCRNKQEQATTSRTLLEKYECLQYAVLNESINNALLIDESLNLLNQLEKQE